MSSDTTTKGPDVRWKPAGVGINPTRMCLGCNQGKSQRGGRGLGPKWRCAGCVLGAKS